MSTVVLAAAAALLMAANPAPGVDRGARIAQQRCAACHAVAGGRSPNLAAPTFRDIRMRYNALSLERELAKISTKGHFEMRPQSINSNEAEDLAAYIETLGPAVH